jgi:hypothetical protein
VTRTLSWTRRGADAREIERCVRALESNDVKISGVRERFVRGLEDIWSEREV